MENTTDRVRSARAWKLFLLLPRMLLQRTEVTGKAGKLVYEERCAQLAKGDWKSLFGTARTAALSKKQ